MDWLAQCKTKEHFGAACSGHHSDLKCAAVRAHSYETIHLIGTHCVYASYRVYS